jgi:hypothetical protein
MYCFRGTINCVARWWPVIPILAVAALKAVVAVGASESFRLVAPIYHALEVTSIEINVCVFACAALITWTFGKIWATGALLLVAVAATLLYGPLSNPILDDPQPYINILKYRAVEVVSAWFTVTIFLVVVVANCSTMLRSPNIRPRWRGGLLVTVSTILLLVPFVYSAFSRVLWFWWIGLVNLALLPSLYCGLLGAAWFVYRFTRSQDSEEPGAETIFNSTVDD